MQAHAACRVHLVVWLPTVRVVADSALSKAAGSVVLVGASTDKIGELLSSLTQYIRLVLYDSNNFNFKVPAPTFFVLCVPAMMVRRCR